MPHSENDLSHKRKEMNALIDSEIRENHHINWKRTIKQWNEKSQGKMDARFERFEQYSLSVKFIETLDHRMKRVQKGSMEKCLISVLNLWNILFMITKIIKENTPTCM